MLGWVLAVSLTGTLDAKSAQHALKTLDRAPPKMRKQIASDFSERFVALAKSAPATPKLRELAGLIDELRSAAAVDSDAEPERKKAQAHYEAHNLGLAWVEFGRATAKAPTNASLWADYGLVSFKTERTELGRQASLIAIALDSGAARRSAAFNLGKFAKALPLSEGTLASSAGCDESFEVALRSWSRLGCDAHYCYSGQKTFAFFARTAEAATVCGDAFEEGLRTEEDSRASARAIGDSVTTSCPMVVARDSMETSGGVDENDQGRSLDVTECAPVFVDACEGEVVFDCAGYEGFSVP
ncbi:MAG: hypothetical protein QM723_38720 [Myxococcaceae bacterium]